MSDYTAEQCDDLADYAESGGYRGKLHGKPEDVLRFAARAIRERDALQARIEGAQVGWWDPEEGLLSVASLFNRQLTDGCKRVALVVLDNG